MEATQTFTPCSLEAALTVNDLEASIAWYCEVIGFTLDRKHEREGRIVAASLSAGDVRILLAQDDGSKGTDRLKGEGFSLQLTTTQDADELVEGIRSRGGEIAAEPVDTPWGARVFRLVDPDGFRLTVSSVKEVSQ